MAGQPAPDFALPGLYETADGLTRKDLGGPTAPALWCVRSRCVRAISPAAGMTVAVSQRIRAATRSEGCTATDYAAAGSAAVVRRRAPRVSRAD